MQLEVQRQWRSCACSSRAAASPSPCMSPNPLAHSTPHTPAPYTHSTPHTPTPSTIPLRACPLTPWPTLPLTPLHLTPKPQTLHKNPYTLNQVLPYAIFLVVPILGRMSDVHVAVRQTVTKTFATLLKLLPLEAGIPDPEGLRFRFGCRCTV